jgi:hypothetical protein
MRLREGLRLELIAHRGTRQHDKLFDFTPGGGLKDRMVRARMSLAACSCQSAKGVRP